MIRSSRSGMGSRRILIAVAAMLVPMIAGCEAGFSAPSLHWHQPADGTGLQIPDSGITISNAFVLGAPIGAVLKPGQNAGLFLGLVNIAGPDRLLSIRAPKTAASVSLPGGGINLWRDHSVLLTGPRPAIILQHLSHAITGGSVIRLLLTFQHAGQVKLLVPVLPRAQYYRTLSPAPAPTPTATATVSPSPSGQGHRRKPRTSPSPSGTP